MPTTGEHENEEARGLLQVDHSDEWATPCPCCGAPTSTPLAQGSALLAVCDVLVVRALEGLGKRIVRADRSRYRTMGTRPWHEAHTIWRPDEHQVVKSLKGSWDVIPALLLHHGLSGVSARSVEEMLDQYVRDLAITGTAHSIDELRYRLSELLRIVLPPAPAYSPDGAWR